MKRHGRDNFYVVGEGIYTLGREEEVSVLQEPSTTAALRKFRFSRLGPVGDPVDTNQRQVDEKVALAMTSVGGPDDPDSTPVVPAGFTYLGQFVDHDLTKDVTDVHLGQDVTVDQLLQGRSPSLDLDSLYGLGPDQEPQFYEADGVKLRLGRSLATTFPPNDPFVSVDHDGFDLPRVGVGSTAGERRLPLIPDGRNDENLAVAQTHLMFMKFHNAVIAKLAGDGVPSTLLFPQARELVVKHYQWMLRHDFLPRIVDPAILDDVFTNGRRFFEVPPPYEPTAELYRVPDERLVPRAYRYTQPGDTPTMPIEFSVAAYRLGHSMVRDSYEWNRVFSTGGPFGNKAGLDLLFHFTGTSGNMLPGGDLDDPTIGGEGLPSNWIADFRRLYDFSEAGLDLEAPDGINPAKRLDTRLVDPLAALPLGSFGGRMPADGSPLATGAALNLAFRNLTRAEMVRLASGQQMAELLGIEPLKPADVINGSGGAVLPDDPAGVDGLTEQQKQFFGAHTPLWFYVLREAELADGRLTGVGGRIVAEVFHRAMEGSVHSIVRDASWRPSLGPDPDTFRMVHLLVTAVRGNLTDLFPLG